MACTSLKYATLLAVSNLHADRSMWHEYTSSAYCHYCRKAYCAYSNLFPEVCQTKLPGENIAHAYRSQQIHIITRTLCKCRKGIHFQHRRMQTLTMLICRCHTPGNCWPASRMHRGLQSTPMKRQSLGDVILEVLHDIVKPGCPSVISSAHAALHECGCLRIPQV